MNHLGNQHWAGFDPAPWEPAPAAHMMRRHAPASLAIIVASLALAAMLSFQLPRSYTAQAVLSYDPQTPSIRGGGPLPMTDAQRDAGIDAELGAATTPAVAQDVARALYLGDRGDRDAGAPLAREADAIAAASDRKPGREEALAGALLDHVKPARVGQTSVFTISYTDASADSAARIANLFAASSLKAAVARKAALADAIIAQLDLRLGDARRQLGDADTRLADYRLTNNLLDVPDSPALEQEVSGLRGQLSEARGQAALAGARSASSAFDTVVGGGAGGSVDTTPVSALTQQRAAAAADLATLLGRYGEKHPDVIAARQRLAEFDAQLGAALHGDRSSALVEARAANARAGAVSSGLAAAEARLGATLRHDAQRLDLQNTAVALRAAYQDLLRLRADQIAARALIQPDAQQIAFAVPPLRPRFPPLGPMMLVGLMIGSAIAVVAALMRNAWQRTLATTGDVGRWLEVDYFAPLPELAGADPVGAVLRDPGSAFAASFRGLAGAALHAASGGGPSGHVLGIASALPGEGKTTTAIAIGRGMAATGTRAVLVDGGGGEASRILAGIDADGRGWQHVLNGSARLDEITRIDPSGLMLLPSASAMPACARGLARIVAELRQTYELVIVDMPAIMTDAGGLDLLPAIDALVLLARWRSTPVRVVRSALRRIDAAGGRVCGVALARVGGGRSIGSRSEDDAWQRHAEDTQVQRQ